MWPEKEWLRDTAPGGTERLDLPPLLDGANCRAVLRSAQLTQPPLAHNVRQLRSELSGESKKGVTASLPTLLPVERALYRLCPEDEVLERKVNLATCCV